MKKTYNLKTLVIALLMFSSAAVMAQSTVGGSVKDSNTGEALIGAAIVIKGTGIGVTSDVAGNFELTSDTPFPWSLEVSFVGYSAFSVQVSAETSDLGVSLEADDLLSEVVISASRKPEKIQDAPASISLIDAKDIAQGANATDALRSLVNVAGVQIQQQSASRINISMRGSSGLFGTGAFPIMDYRSLIGAGIGTFQSDQAGISNIDLQKIEVVRGPGSALYGPNVTQGVIHFITKNPIDFPGTTVEMFAGELKTVGGSIRHAGRNKNKTFGYKINVTHRRGEEFTLDPNDPSDAIQIARFLPGGGVFQPAITNGIVDVTQPATQLFSAAQLDEDGDGNPMANDWDNTSINTTLEFRPNADMSVFVSGGYNDAKSVFYNEQGEGLSQSKEIWTQARMQYKGLFAQFFVVDNDGGTKDAPSFLYQTGNRTPVGRQQIEAQLQYNFDTPSLLNANWTVGYDYRVARQDTENLVYGRNEDDDTYRVDGGYVQGKFKLNDKIDMVLAGRYDQFNFINEGAFAPRAAFVYKVNPRHTVRASYNKANATVSNLQLNIDFPLAGIIPGAFDIWLYGNKTEQTFNGGSTGWFYGGPGSSTGLLLAVPFGAVAAPTLAALGAGLAGALGASASPAIAATAPGAASAIVAAIGAINPLALGETGSLSPGFNIFDGTPLTPITAPISKISDSHTFEVGYKGLIEKKLGVTFDLYHIIQRNFSQFTAISPAYVLLGQENISVDLGNAVQSASEAGVVQALTDYYTSVGFGPAAGPTAQAIWASIAPSVNGAFQQGGDGFEAAIAPLPFHAVNSTDQVPATGGTHLAAGYRTFDERSFSGADLGLEYYHSDDITFYGNYSWVSTVDFMQNVIGNEAAGKLPSYLNIPQNKFRLGVTYAPALGFNGNIAFQHDDSYFASAGQFTGNTQERNIFDIAVGYTMDNGLAFNLSAQNAFNNEYRTLPNMPKIGRRALLKVTYSFGQD